jgi:quinol monooxygenase YgiN
MKEDFYTLTSWKVKNNNLEEFLHTWEKEFAPAFVKLNPYSRVTLIQSLENPNTFFSFGTWANAEQMQSARANENYRTVISKLITLCTEAKPGSFKNILSVSGNR